MSSIPAPAEILRALEQGPDRYEVFLSEQGSLARAAYKLATLKLEARGLRPPPNAREVHVASLEIHARSRLTGSPPPHHLIVTEVRSLGLPIAGES